MSAYTCPRCHAPIVAGQPFCKHCGLPLDPKSLAAFQAQTVPVQVVPTPPVATTRQRRWLVPIIGGTVGLCALCGIVNAVTRPPAAVLVPTTPTLLAVAATSAPPTVVAKVPPTLAPPTALPITAVPPTKLPPTALPATATLIVLPQPYTVAPAQTTAPSTTYASGGLGLAVVAWEQHGAPNMGSVADGGANYEQNKYIVAFWEGAVFTILRQAPDNAPLTPATMHREAHAMLPQDATLIKTFSEPNVLGGADNTVELFSSAALIARYPANAKIGPVPWGDGMAPGTLSILYDSAGIGWTMAAGYTP